MRGCPFKRTLAVILTPNPSYQHVRLNALYCTAKRPFPVVFNVLGRRLKKVRDIFKQSKNKIKILYFRNFFVHYSTWVESKF